MEQKQNLVYIINDQHSFVLEDLGQKGELISIMILRTLTLRSKM